MDRNERAGMTRRDFVERVGVVGAALGLAGVPAAGGAEPAEPPRDADGNVIAGFEKTGKTAGQTGKGWRPFSDRKIRVGSLR